MLNLLYVASVPILAFNLGFINPQIDLNHNIRKAYKTQVIQQKHGTEKKELYGLPPKSNFSRRNFRDRLRERYGERQNPRNIAQFYVHSWFIASFNLELDDNTLLRVKDVFAKAISSVGNVTKGKRKNREWETITELKKIQSIFNRELKGTLDTEQYRKLIEMTGKTNRKKERNKKDQGET